MRRKIIGGRAGGGRHQNAVGDEFGQPLLAIDRNAQLGDLRGLAQQRHFVDGVGDQFVAMDIDGGHQQRMDDRGLGLGDAIAQAALAIFVHEKADRAAVHAVDRLARPHEAMQRAQHQPVAPQRHEAVGVLRRNVAIFGGEAKARLLRLRRSGSEKSEFLVLARLSARRAHETIPLGARLPTRRSDRQRCNTPARGRRERGGGSNCGETLPGDGVAFVGARIALARNLSRNGPCRDARSRRTRCASSRLFDSFNRFTSSDCHHPVACVGAIHVRRELGWEIRPCEVCNFSRAFSPSS